MSIINTTKKYLKDFNGEEVESTIVQNFEYAMESKNLIKDKLIEKGVDINDTTKFRDYADKIDEIVPSESEWKPQPDWWDIEKIVKEDTEDYPAKAIVLMTDTTLKQAFTKGRLYNAEKIVFSDGQVITESDIANDAKDITIGENGLKECSQGYKTYYAILYLKTTTIDFSYTSPTSAFNACKFIYFYNVEALTCNSSFGIGSGAGELEAWTTNKPFKIWGNMGCAISRTPMLQKLPEISEFTHNSPNGWTNGNIAGVIDAPKLKKSEYMKIFANYTESDTGRTYKRFFKYILWRYIRF